MRTRELSLRMRDWEVTPGLFALRVFFFFLHESTVSGHKLETHRSSSAREKRWLTLVSSHSGSGQICPLGAERPSSIAQPFDLSSQTRPFLAVMDDFLHKSHDLQRAANIGFFPPQPLCLFAFISTVDWSGSPHSHVHLFLSISILPEGPVALCDAAWCRVTDGCGNHDRGSFSLWHLFTGVIFHFFNIQVPECAFNGFPGAISSNVFCVKVLYPECYGRLPWWGNLSIRNTKASLSVLFFDTNPKLLFHQTAVSVLNL